MVGWGKGPKTPALGGATLQSCLCPLLCKHLSNVLFSIVAWRTTVAKTDLFLKQKKTIFFLKKSVFVYFSSYLKMFINQFTKEGVCEKAMSIVRDFFKYRNRCHLT